MRFLWKLLLAPEHGPIGLWTGYVPANGARFGESIDAWENADNQVYYYLNVNVFNDTDYRPILMRYMVTPPPNLTTADLVQWATAKCEEYHSLHEQNPPKH